jgi:hypothetical protein
MIDEDEADRRTFLTTHGTIELLGITRIPASIPRSPMGESGGSPGVAGRRQTVDGHPPRLSRPAGGQRERSHLQGKDTNKQHSG